MSEAQSEVQAEVKATSHPARSSRRMRLIADAALLGISAVWGATFFMVKEATSVYPVLAFLALRFTLASLVLVPFVWFGRRRPTRQEIAWGIVAGVLFWLGYVLQTFSLRMIDSGRTGFFTGLYVVMVPFLAWILLRHRLTIRVLIGTVLALVGLTLLSYAPGGNLLGDAFAILCALSFALQIIAVERFPKGSDWHSMSLIQAMCVAGLSGILLPIMAAVHSCDQAVCQSLAPLADPLPTSLPLMVLGVAAFTGFIATALGLALQVWAQTVLPPSDTALIFAMESPWSEVFGVAFRGEMLSLGGVFGCGLILSGMLITALGEPPGENIEVKQIQENLFLER